MSTRLVIALAAVVAITGISAFVPSKARSDDPKHVLVDKIVVASDRHAPTSPAQPNNGEIYLLNLDGSGEERLTHNDVGDAFGSLSPDGKKVVFDSNRSRLSGEPLNTSDLFLMKADGRDQTFLIRGGSPTWSPDGKYIAFHASASGTGKPINNNPGAATADSDIFILQVGDFLEHGTPPTNLTNDPMSVDDDPDWSADGRWIVYTGHDVNQRPVPPAPLDYTSAEIYVRAADGTGSPIRLTNNAEEERAPNWSHVGDRIAYMCRTGSPRFEICVMAADGSGKQQLTINDFPDLTNAWTPDDDRIIFQRAMPVPGAQARNELWWVKADGTHEEILVSEDAQTGQTLFPDVGVLRVKTG